MRVCMLVCACAWARGRGRVCTVCEKRGKKKGNLLCLPSTFFAPVPLFTLPVFSRTLPCRLAVRCPSNRLRQQAVAAAAAAYTRVLYIRPSYSAFFFPFLSSFFYPQELAQSDKLRRELIPFKVYEGEAEKNQRCVPTKNHLPPLSFFFFPPIFFSFSLFQIMSPTLNSCRLTLLLASTVSASSITWTSAIQQ